MPWPGVLLLGIVFDLPWHSKQLTDASRLLQTFLGGIRHQALAIAWNQTENGSFVANGLSFLTSPFAKIGTTFGQAYYR